MLGSSRSYEIKVAVTCFRTEFLSLLDTIFPVMSLPMRVGGLNLESRSGHEPCSRCMHAAAETTLKVLAYTIQML